MAKYEPYPTEVVKPLTDDQIGEMFREMRYKREIEQNRQRRRKWMELSIEGGEI